LRRLSRIRTSTIRLRWRLSSIGRVFGVSPRVHPEPFDPDGARALLIQAGYPNDFRITLHGPNDRRADALQAVAQMLSRIGDKTEVVALPSAVFSPGVAAVNSASICSPG
jgi:ABC-type transport system substrate-binding protein